MARQENTTNIDRLATSLALDDPVTSIKQVSPARGRALATMGITSVRDLLANYPHRYIDMSSVKTIAQAVVGEQCTVRGVVHDIKLKRPRRKLVLVEITVVDGSGTLIVTAFRQPWLAENLESGMAVAVSGKLEFNYGFKRMTNPFIAQIEPDQEDVGLIVPVHSTTAKISAGMMRRFVRNALDAYRGLYDPIPISLRAKYRLMSRQVALECIHNPRSIAEQKQARRRLAYEELLLLEIAMMEEQQKRAIGKAPTAHVVDGKYSQAFAQCVPFTLTEEQEQARRDIEQRMAKPYPMNHMLLGDVGCGKTIVSAYALAMVADSRSQAAYMAPTEILVRQHAASLGPLFDESGITWAVLTAATTADERTQILEKLQMGLIDVLFGTHALLEKDVIFKNLTLVVIDEQQRFGVEQRAELLGKGACPDALYLTATPIPRTLALALFGNLSLSYIHAKPKSSAPRKTFVHTRQKQGVAYDAALEALKRGEQVYVVCPLVGERADEDSAIDEENNNNGAEAYEYAMISIEHEDDMRGSNIAAAEAEMEFLQRKVFVDYQVGLLHGRLKPADKQQAMEDFRAGVTQVLVATTVIEVGVDVPNATVMIVEDADRFGLAQLHQLRGRVGRGDLAGEVHLISSTKSPVALERLAAMERIEDGFELATYDLSLRREGDILGNRQHGASMLKLVNIVRDGGIVEAAHDDALQIMLEDPKLESEQYRAIAREARIVYRRAEDLSGG